MTTLFRLAEKLVESSILNDFSVQLQLCFLLADTNNQFQSSWVFSLELSVCPTWVFFQVKSIDHECDVIAHIFLIHLVYIPIWCGVIDHCNLTKYRQYKHSCNAWFYQWRTNIGKNVFKCNRCNSVNQADVNMLIW